MRAPKELLSDVRLVDEREFADDRNFVTALARGLEILRCFGPNDEVLGNAEIAKRTGIPKPTVSRLTYTLTRLGYLRYSERLEKYQLGAGVLALGYGYLASIGVRAIARPLMQELADATDCQVSLGSPDRLSMVYLEVCQGAGPLILRVGVGARLPMATSAIGRAYLAVLPESERERYCRAFQQQDPENWPRIKEGLERAIEDYRRLGFCMSEGAWDPDISGVAVPLLVGDAGSIMVFNCGGSSLRLSQRVLEQKLGPRLVEMVRRVEAQLGVRRAS